MAETKQYSVEQLLAIESQLDRSFVVCVVVVLAQVGWSLALVAMGRDAAVWGGLVLLGLMLLMAGAYIWFAISAGRAARAVGSHPVPFVLWVLAAPFLSLIPIPLLSTALLASPLSLKFLLSGQLRTEIHDTTFQQG